MAAEHLYQEGDDALHDERIAICRKHELAIHIVALQPYTALAASIKFCSFLYFSSRGFSSLPKSMSI
mgnify:CR=1 FL=1